VVLLFAVVGFTDVLHTKPLTVTVAPPLDDIFPPPVAVVEAILVIGVVVVRVGTVATLVVNCPIGKLLVPDEFLA
jgi:hypothetical protein